MIHYDELAKQAAKLKDGQALILKVDGMLPVGKSKDGEPLPPAVENGTLVKVVKVAADSVDVVTAEGKKLTFAHTVGARRLERTPLMDFPKSAPAGGQ